MILTRKPLRDWEDLDGFLASRSDSPRPLSVAVEGLIFDENFQWILHERGEGARDEVGKLEGIGGRFEGEATFRDTLEREIREEVGLKAQIEILGNFEVRLDTVVVPDSNKERHWVIVSHLCRLIGGELEIREPHKNRESTLITAFRFGMLSLRSLVPRLVPHCCRCALSGMSLRGALGSVIAHSGLSVSGRKGSSLCEGGRRLCMGSSWSEVY